MWLMNLHDKGSLQWSKFCQCQSVSCGEIVIFRIFSIGCRHLGFSKWRNYWLTGFRGPMAAVRHLGFVFEHICTTHVDSITVQNLVMIHALVFIISTF